MWKTAAKVVKQRVCDILFSTLKLKTNFWLLIYSEVFPAYISSEIPGDFLDTWKISSWAIFKLSMSEKGEKKKQYMEWEFEFVLKEEKSYFALSFPSLEFPDNTLPEHFLFLRKKKIAFVPKPSMNILCAFSTSAHQGIFKADLRITVKQASPDTNQITHHNDK